MTEAEMRNEMKEIRTMAIRTDERSKSNTHRLDEVENDLKTIKGSVAEILQKLNAKPGIKFWAPLIIPLVIPAVTLFLVVMGYPTA